MDYNNTLSSYNDRLTNILSATKSDSFYNFGTEPKEVDGYIRSSEFNFEPTKVTVTNQLQRGAAYEVISGANTRYHICGTPAVTCGDYIYCFGGWSADLKSDAAPTGNDSTDIYRFDPRTGTIELLSTQLAYKTSCNVACVIDGLIYLVGGGYTNTIQVFNPTLNTISTLDLTLPYRMVDGAVGAYGSCIYICGGDYSGVGYSDKIMKVDLINKSVTMSNTTLFNPSRDMGTYQYEDKIYMAGGRTALSETDYSTIVSCYDMKNDKVIKICDLPGKAWLRRPSVAVIDDYLYIIGTNRQPNSLYKTFFQRFNLLTGEWTDFSDRANETLEECVAAVYGDSFYNFGGVRRASGDGAWSHLNTVKKHTALPFASSEELIFYTDSEGTKCSPYKASTFTTDALVSHIYKGAADGTLSEIEDAQTYHNSSWINI